MCACVLCSILLCLERLEPFLVSRRKVSEPTAADLGDVESQTQPERLYEGLPNLAERKRLEDTMSVMALVATQFMMHDVDDEDMSSTCHKAKSNSVWERVETEEQDGASTGPKCRATASQVKETSAAANDKLMAMFAVLTVNLTTGLTTMNKSMERFKIDMRTEVKQELREVVKEKEVNKDTVELKEMNESMKTEMESGFENEGYERKKIRDELATACMSESFTLFRAARSKPHKVCS